LLGESGGPSTGLDPEGPRRFAFVYDAVYPWVKGGAERRYYELARALAAQGHDVHWYGMRYWPGPNTRRIEGILYHGVCRPRPLYTRSGRRSISQAVIFGVGCLRLIVSGGLSGCQVVDCCGFPFFSLFSVRLATFIRRRLMVVTCHEVWGARYWDEYLGPAGRLGALVERAALRGPSRIISVSEHTRRRLATEIGAPGAVTVVPNGVDVALIDRVAPGERTVDVLYVGRLCDFKNVDLLLGALVRLRESFPALRCDVVGDGPERARLERLAASLGLREHVQFAGFLDDGDEVYARMKAARVLVVPSQREGFGMVVLEANAAGIPVIVADYPANAAKDLIGRHNGAVVAPDPESLAVAVETFLRTGADEQRERCRAVAKDHDWAAVARRWEAAVSWAG